MVETSGVPRLISGESRLGPCHASRMRPWKRPMSDPVDLPSDAIVSPRDLPAVGYPSSFRCRNSKVVPMTDWSIDVRIWYDVVL